MPLIQVHPSPGFSKRIARRKKKSRRGGAVLDGFRAPRRLVHRDLKPSNVLLDLTSGGVQPRIADFGVARSATSDVTQAGALLGTPVYSAPEQLRNAATADARADLWSLGVMLYELLTGALPFRGDGLVALVEAMEAESYATLGATFDPRWDALVRDLLRARPEARLCDLEEIRNRIDTICPPSDRSALGAGTALATVAWRMRAPEPESVAATSGTTNPLLTRPDNLPRQRNAFVGRGAEASTLEAHLDHSRLVTVTGRAVWAGVSRSTARSLRGGFRESPSATHPARSVDGILHPVARGLDIPLGRPITQLGHDRGPRPLPVRHRQLRASSSTPQTRSGLARSSPRRPVPRLGRAAAPAGRVRGPLDVLSFRRRTHR
jgi:serine/threonine protein kinase